MKGPRPDPPPGDVLYRERRFELRRCAVPLRGGGVAHRGLLVHPGAVVILPVFEDGSLLLIRNHRWQIGHPLLELPAGTRDGAEDPIACAHRELIEETGYRAETLVAGGPFYGAPGCTTEVMYPFLARGLTHVGQRLEADERIEVVRMRVDGARRALLDGTVADGKTLAILGRYLLGGGV